MPWTNVHWIKAVRCRNPSLDPVELTGLYLIAHGTLYLRHKAEADDAASEFSDLGCLPTLRKLRQESE